MPGSDSPPPFAIRFRTRPGEPRESEPREGEPTPGDRLYERTLELTALVAALADNLEVARFHVRDRLDRDATQLALCCRRAAGDRAPSSRRKAYRDAKPYAHECGALLDIIGLRLQRAGRDHRIVDDAKAVLSDISAALDHLASR
jgi:hypothetical protein